MADDKPRGADDADDEASASARPVEKKPPSDGKATSKKSKTKKGRAASRASEASAGEPVSGDGGETFLRLLGDARYERRFEPRASIAAIAGMVAMSIGAALVGAGTYGQWLRSDDLGPHPWSPYLLGAGAVVLLVVAFLGPRGAKVVRVGDGGVAVEREPGEIDRIAWSEVARVLASDTFLTVQASGRSIAIPLREQKEAAALAVFEATERIPSKVDASAKEKTSKPDPDAGESLPLDPPQIAGARCRKSDRPITFERDARLCGRCGEVYLKDSVPRRCLTCDARLR